MSNLSLFKPFFLKGKIISHAQVEVSRAIDTFTIAAEESVRRSGEFTQLDISSSHRDISSLSTRFPIGLLGFITPFNFPLNLVAHKIGKKKKKRKIIKFKKKKKIL